MVGGPAWLTTVVSMERCRDMKVTDDCEGIAHVVGEVVPKEKKRVKRGKQVSFP